APVLSDLPTVVLIQVHWCKFSQ
ncbi:hypothetical protein TNIN_365581, partial [Trichonephila inaurata madagascariensis]